MERKKTFRDLIAWRKGMDLTKAVYLATQRMPKEERFGLTSQMRRAAVSIPSNIAEGNARDTLGDYLRFLTIARGSLAELETQAALASELNMLTNSEGVTNLLVETDRVLQGLIRSLQRKRDNLNEH